MEIRVLKYFLMVAREENFTKAAELLHITQPTLSRQLMQLEDDLGVQLFARNKHSVSLTEDGVLFRRRAEEIVILADKAEREMRGKYENLSGEVSIGCGETVGMNVIADCIRLFRQEHKEVSFHIYTSSADDIKYKMEKGLLDIGLVTEPVEIGKYQYVRLPKKEKWGILVPQDSDFAKKEVIRPKDLCHVPLLLVGRELVKNELQSWFGKYYEQIEIAATYNLLLNASMMAYNRVGVTLCLELGDVIQGMKFIPLYPQLETGCAIIWKKQANSTAVDAFISYMRNFVEQIEI